MFSLVNRGNKKEIYCLTDNTNSKSMRYLLQDKYYFKNRSLWNNVYPHEGMNCIDVLGTRKWACISQRHIHSIRKPYLAAAVATNNLWTPPQFPNNRAQLHHIFRNREGHLMKDTPENRAIIAQATMSRENYVGTDKDGNEIYLKKNSDGTQSWAEVRDGVIRDSGLNSKGQPAKLNVIARKKDENGKEIEEKDLQRWPHRIAPIKGDPRRYLKNRDLSKPRTLADLVQKAIVNGKFIFKKPPDFKGPGGSSGGGDKGPKGPSGGKPFAYKPFLQSPGLKQFHQLLQQTHLVKSYNANHPEAPVPSKGSIREEIGGVSCGAHYLQGLFESPDALFEREHLFCIPTLADGSMPFTDKELRQILRELTIGIYVHDTVPFFSLHFTQNSGEKYLPRNSSLFPVIHPAYANTLVGRVISTLDYTMKGYLNGGVYDESNRLIAFEPYCRTEMSGADQRYFSLEDLRVILKQIQDDKGFDENIKKIREELGIKTTATAGEDKVLDNFEGFKNSFRIIAKQNSIQKEGGLFVVDGDFDVKYEIQPSPEYQEALDKYLRIYGTYPASYTQLIKTYDYMASRIHDHMAKLPLCRKYFAMLKVINFFSAYFSTLKKHRKMPILPGLEESENKGCRPLFDHLPIKISVKAPLQINIREALIRFYSSCRTLLGDYLNGLRDHLSNAASAAPFNQEGKDKLLQELTVIFRNNISAHSSIYVRRNLSEEQKIPEIQELAKTVLNKLIDGYTTAVAKENPHKVDLQLFLNSFSESFPNQETACPNADFSPLFLAHEMNRELLDKQKRIVGGCGQQLEELPIRSSAMTVEALRYNWTKMSDLLPESLVEMRTAKSVPEKAMFRLEFEEVPLEEAADYAWMESRLLIPEGQNEQMVEAREKIQELMVAGKKEEFKALIKQTKNLRNLKDRYHRTLLHNAATLKDPFYLEALFKRGLQTSPDVDGFYPLHYAAMAGSVEALLLLMDQNDSFLSPLWTFFGSKEPHDRRSNLSYLDVAVQHNKRWAAGYMINYLVKKKEVWRTTKDGHNLLHHAMNAGNVEVINGLLNYKGVVTSCLNENAEEGGTPLMLACELDSPAIVKRLLELGANPNLKRKDGVTAIEIAIKRNCAPVLALLLEKAEPSSRALSLAAMTADDDIAELLNKGDRLYKIDNSCGDTLLHRAIRAGNLSFADYIIEACPNFHLFNKRNQAGETPLSLATSLGIYHLVEKLVTRGVEFDYNILFRSSYHSLYEKLLRFKELDPDDLKKYLSIAAKVGNYRAITDILIPKGVKVEEWKDSNGWLYPHYMAKCDSYIALDNIFSMEGDISIPLKEEGNKTLAYLAAEHGSEHVLQMLVFLMKHRKMSWENHYQDRHLFYAVVESGSISQVNRVLKILDRDTGKFVERPLDSQGTRAVHLAAMKGSIPILTLLYRKRVEMNIKDNKGNTPLYYAVRAGAVKAVEYLLKEGPEVTVNSKILHLASSQDDEKLFQLIAEKASQKALDNALKKAIASGHSLAKTRLLNRGARGELLDQEDREDQAVYAFAQALKEQEVSKLALALNNLPPNEPVWIKHGEESLRATPLQHLLYEGPLQKYRPLIEKECERKDIDPNVKDSQGNTLGHLLVKANFSPQKITGLDLFCVNHRNQTLLHIAAEYASKELLQELLALQPALDINATDETNKTPLFYALESDDEERVHLLIEKGANLNHTNFQWETPLFVAAKQKQPLALIKRLITAGADINQRATIERWTPLHYALLLNNDEMARFLIMQGAYRHALTNEGDHALHIATHMNNVDMIRLFAATGMPLDIKDGLGREPLHIAAALGELETLKTLCKLDPSEGWRVNVPFESKPAVNPAQERFNARFKGATPLIFAAWAGNAEMVRWLLQHGADPEAMTKQNESALSFAAASPAPHEIIELLARHPAIHQQKFLLPAAISAISRDRVDLLKKFYRWGIEPHGDLSLHRNGLHYASLYGALHCTQWLLENGDDPFEKDPTGRTALEVAAVNGSPEQFQLLLEHTQPYINDDNNPGETLAYLAAEAGNINHLMTLILKGASIQIPDARAYSPLHIAAHKGRTEVVKLLLACGADPTEKTTFHHDTPLDLVEAWDDKTRQVFLEFQELVKASREGETLLHRAVRWAFAPAVQLLTHLASLEEINQQDGDGNTALHIAVQKNQIEAIRYLLEAGAEINVKNQAGYSPLALAMEGKDPELVHSLLRMGADPQQTLK